MMRRGRRVDGLRSVAATPTMRRPRPPPCRTRTMLPPDPAASNPPRWRISIDTGGTFTDAIGLDPAGTGHRVKIPSSGRLPARLRRTPGGVSLHASHPLPAGFLDGFAIFRPGSPSALLRVERYAGPSGEVELSEGPAPETLPERIEIPVELDGGFSAARLAIAMLVGEPPARISTPLELRLATTRATNALLERRVAPVLFVATEGFADLLRIGDQSRPEIFARAIRRPLPLHAAVVEARHRLEPDGAVVRPLDRDRLRRDAAATLAAGIDTAAICLLHAPSEPSAEQEAAAILGEIGFRRVIASTDLTRRVGYLDRARTTVAEAALGEAIREFIDAAVRPGEPIRVLAMTSAGGLVPGDALRATESLLSGPAAGACGAAAIAAACGFERAIGFDMGGTSTDVARFEDGTRLRPFVEVGGERLGLPSIEIETVAAGGGSIAFLREDGRLEVGPRSAGADPGPACYGRGGPLTVTDVNLLLGRLDRERFGVPIDEDAAMRCADELHRAMQDAPDASPARSLDETLAAILAIADERMASAIERVSTRQGFDPADHALVAFGGAGGQHACSIATRLGIATVVLPAAAGLLSACGLRDASRHRVAERPLSLPLPEAVKRLDAMQASLRAEAIAAVVADGAEPSRVACGPAIAFLRLVGQEASLEVPLEPIATLADRFAEAFRIQHGYERPQRAIEIEAIRIEAREAASPQDPLPPLPPRPSPPPLRRQRMRSGDAWVEAAVHAREAMPAGMAFAGPMLIADETATAVVDVGWRGEVRGDGSIVLTAEGAAAGGGAVAAGLARRPELFAARLASIAEEMGERLRRCSLSVNIRHRLDFSTAILDAEGRLVETAAHLPVHLGALGHAARAVRSTMPLEPGDAVLLNHPAFGGSHLPDVTLLTPLHDAKGRLVAILANRAHHAEIGGLLPGSMAPTARRLSEEGVAIEPIRLCRGGVADFEAFAARLRGAPYPSRTPADNLADLEAQIAANELGRRRLAELCSQIGTGAFLEGLDAISRLGATAVRRAIPSLLPHPRQARIALDDGTPIAVSLRRECDRLIVDFAGSGGVHPGNLNAPLAVVHSAVLYTLRLMLDADLPLNEGLMEAVDLRVPSGLLHPPFCGDADRDPAVAAGNTETSQRVVEALLLAFGEIAPGQSTMNNLLVGDERFAFYETVGGGEGGSRGHAGESGVHTHMTNTRISDAEVLERRIPVRIDAFSLRHGTGGAGRHPGGDGLRRVYRFVAPLAVSIVSQHRRQGPAGAAGGGSGEAGLQRLLRADGSIETLPATAAITVMPGDRLELLTPGGGGWGAVDAAAARS
jgi:5-oxoprolinase (ATP-hydrolysing)